MTIMASLLLNTTTNVNSLYLQANCRQVMSCNRSPLLPNSSTCATSTKYVHSTQPPLPAAAF
jgi:hypothetical protein